MRRAIVVTFAALAALFVATPAFASSQGLTGSLTKNQQTFYTTGRTITVSGTNIYVQKTDGPAIDVKWYKCGNTGVAGAWVAFANPDPTPRTIIGSGFLPNTTFCLAAWDHGTNNTDTWSGTVWWNVST